VRGHRTSGRRWAGTLALVGVSTIAALVLCEAGLRLLAPAALLQPDVPDFAWLAYDPIDGMVNKPGFHAHDPRITKSHLAGELAINALGFRGDEVAVAKPPDVTRIACLGDSGTFGLWLAAGVAWQPDADFRLDNDYPRLLQERLRADGYERVEVINAGVVGYNSSHGVRQLRTRIIPLAPDVLTVRFGFNDHAFSDPATYVQDPVRPAARTLFYTLAPLRLFRLAVARYHRRVGLPAITVPRFADNVRRIAALARAHGMRLLLLDYPLRPLAEGMTPGERLPFLGGARTLADLHQRHQRYQEALREVAAEEGVPLLATRAELGDPASAAFSRADLVHPNAHGAVLIAGRIAEALESRGWLQADRRRAPRTTRPAPASSSRGGAARSVVAARASGGAP
jgi:lysophospholipase L1-like esterase